MFTFEYLYYSLNKIKRELTANADVFNKPIISWLVSES